ncbi:MAG: hypothetical protein ACRD43_08705, partial [Pyrinomonadaceae bacterium]
MIALIVTSFIAAGCSQTMRLRSSRDVPAAEGEAEFSKTDNHNTRVKIEVEHLAPPQNLSPARGTYVVWSQAPNGQVQNLGQMKIASDRKGEFNGSTSLPVF